MDLEKMCMVVHHMPIGTCGRGNFACFVSNVVHLTALFFVTVNDMQILICKHWMQVSENFQGE